MPAVTENPHWAELRTRVAKAPVSPGVYRWLDADGKTLYVGKAKNLRNRLKSYLPTAADIKDGLAKLEKAVGPWKRSLIETFCDLDYTVTGNELEALVLETNLIKEQRPKFNVLMKDDKNYVYVEVTTEELYPTVDVVRRMERKKSTYFGPYLSAFEVHRILDMLQDILVFRACAASLHALNSGKELPKKPCLESHIGQCCGLCTNALTQAQYRERIVAIISFLRGNRDAVKKAAQERMAQAAAQKKFERAGKLRDALKYIDNIEERQIVSDTSREDADIIGVACAATRACVVVLRERDGRIVGEEHHHIAGCPQSTAEVLSAFLPQYVAAQAAVPPLIIFGDDVEDRAVLEQWMSAHTGHRVTLHVPERGKKNKLLQLAEENAIQKLQAQQTKWEAAARNTEQALAELRQILGLKELPHRIECYDISHLGGTETVGSMAVAVDGKLRNDLYRNFTIRTMKDGDIDDYRALQEVLHRRLKHLAADALLERKRWEEKGYTFGKARKADHGEILQILEEEKDHLGHDDVDVKNFLLVRKAKTIVGMGQLVTREGTTELRSLWVQKELRGEHLGELITRLLLRTVKKGKVYVCCDATFTPHYEYLGFKHIAEPPNVIQKRIDACNHCIPYETACVLMATAKDLQTDVSLGKQPNLLVIDGGKGQLSAVRSVQKTMNIDIPTVGLAKREEDIFASVSGNPLPFPKDSQGRFLLMRLRDEAHRIANLHREKRLEHRLFRP